MHLLATVHTHETIAVIIVPSCLKKTYKCNVIFIYITGAKRGSCYKTDLIAFVGVDYNTCVRVYQICINVLKFSAPLNISQLGFSALAQSLTENLLLHGRRALSR